MRIGIYAVGRMKAGPESDLLSRYLDRARKTGSSLGIQDVQVVEVPESRNGSVDAARREEARSLQDRLPDTGLVIALDERGKAMTSDAFKDVIDRAREDGRTISFVIGGADGLDRDLLKSADQRIAFGAMTLPHQLVRIMLAEQIYRAMTMITGHPYHRA